MDRLSEKTVRHIIAAQEVASIVAPDSLQGPARELFERFVAANRERPWNAAHADILASYCRISILAAGELAAIEVEGATIGDKPNPRWKTLLTIDRQRRTLGRFIGLEITHKRLLGTNQSPEVAAREMGALLVEGEQSAAGYMLR